MKITYKKALAALRNLNPDVVYSDQNGCSYEKRGAPSCGVGQVLHNDFGFTVKQLKKLDDWGSFEDVVDAMRTPEKPDTNSSDLRPLGRKYDVTLKAEMLLNRFQSQQDIGVRWGNATDDAVKFVKKNYGR